MTIRAVCIHHTASPTEEQWVAKGGWPYWGAVLRRYYESKGWAAMPHVFAGPDGWHVLWPLEQDGRGVGGGYLEPGLRHIEIVGNYNQRLPMGETLNAALDATATILVRAGLSPKDVTHHTAVVGPGVTDCPGAMLIDSWTWFTDLVAAEWWRKKMDVLEACIASRFDDEEIQRLLESGDKDIADGEALIERGKLKHRQARLRHQQRLNRQNGIAYKPEIMLGGPTPEEWRG